MDERRVPIYVLSTVKYTVFSISSVFFCVFYPLLAELIAHLFQLFSVLFTFEKLRGLA